MAQMLASAPNALLLGEMRPVLADPAGHRACDCGVDADSCSFWSQTSPWRRESADPYSFKALARTLATVLRSRRQPDRGLPAVSLLQRMESADKDRLLVDSSKTPMGILLWRLAGVRPPVVHVVRDPRVVAEKQRQPPNVSKLRRESPFRTWVL
jgi:hypothetical protein